MPKIVEKPVIIRHYFSYEVDAVPHICPNCIKPNAKGEQPNYFGISAEPDRLPIKDCLNCGTPLVPA